jgi:hypothetical protein
MKTPGHLTPLQQPWAKSAQVVGTNPGTRGYSPRDSWPALGLLRLVLQGRLIAFTRLTPSMTVCALYDTLPLSFLREGRTDNCEVLTRMCTSQTSIDRITYRLERLNPVDNTLIRHLISGVFKDYFPKREQCSPLWMKKLKEVILIFSSYKHGFLHYRRCKAPLTPLSGLKCLADLCPYNRGSIYGRVDTTYRPLA